MLSASDVSALAVAVAALLTAIIGAAVNILTILRSERKVDAVSMKADVITRHVNSTATAAVAKIEHMQEELTALRALVAKQDQTAALAAQLIAERKE